MNPIAKIALMPIALPLRARFTAGKDLRHALEAADRVRALGAVPMLNYLGEHFQNPADVEQQCRMYRALIPELQPGDRIVLKPSQIGFDIPGFGMIRARENFAKLLRSAHTKNVLVELDIEDALRARASIGLALAFNSAHVVPTRVALAARIKTSTRDADLLSTFHVPIRLVKGAYEDTSNFSYSGKEQIQRRYKDLVTFLLVQGTNPAFATHDNELIEHVLSEANRLGIAKGKFEFQFLKGFRPKMQRELIAQGYRVAIYIPFGPLWFEYGMRRWKFFRRNPKDLFNALFC